jgi:predicted permease
MSVAATRFETRDGLTELTRDGAGAVRAVPGVVSAAAACCVPLETVWQLPFIVDGRPPDTLIRNGRLLYSGFAGWTFVSPGYFDVLGIPVVSGRDFSDRDGAGAPGVVIINEEMARRFWPGRNPLGDRLIVGKGMRPEYDHEPIRQIIAVVGNVRDTGITRPPRPAMYVPIAQEPDGVTALNTRLLPIVWLARTGGNPLAAARAIERALTKVAALPTSRTRTMEEVVAESTARARFNTVVMTAFGATALLLAAVGVYGLMAYVVGQRNGEIGVRLALGAQRWQVASMVMRQGAAIVALGVALGIGLSFWAVRIVAGLLFQVPARDPLVFAAVPLLLGGVAVAAVWIPARRAMRVDPIVSLRKE